MFFFNKKQVAEIRQRLKINLKNLSLQENSLYKAGIKKQTKQIHTCFIELEYSISLCTVALSGFKKQLKLGLTTY